MPALTPRALADLRQRFLGTAAASDFATTAQGSQAESAYSFANRPSGFATTGQGANADEAHGWGNHAAAGYQVAATLPLFRRFYGTNLTNPITLSPAPLSGSAIQVFLDTGSGAILKKETADYTVAGAVVTIPALGAGHWVHIYYQG